MVSATHIDNPGVFGEPHYSVGKRLWDCEHVMSIMLAQRDTGACTTHKLFKVKLFKLKDKPL